MGGERERSSGGDRGRGLVGGDRGRGLVGGDRERSSGRREREV